METPPTKQTVDVPTLDVNRLQSFPFVLSGFSTLLLKKMELKRLSVHYTRIINNERVPIDFDIVRKKDREKKCIAYYINGLYLKNNLDL